MRSVAHILFCLLAIFVSANAPATEGNAQIWRSSIAAKSKVPRITEKCIQRIEQHLSRPGLEDILGGAALNDPANARMIERLRAGETTPQDINFYMHELKESAIMNRGVGAHDAHLQTLQWQGIPYIRGFESQIYAPDAVELFNTLPK